MNKNNENYFWEKQKNDKWKTLTNPLTRDLQIHSQFNNLITTFYWKFREHKGIPEGTYTPEIDFQGFKKFKDFSKATKMGHCKFELNIKWLEEINGKKVEGSEIYEAKMSIVLNQKFLLDKLGMDKWFSSEDRYLSVSFEELIATIAHELAHAYQNTIRVNNGKEVKSQCESTGDRDTSGKLLYPELAAEHTALSEEVKRMIENSAEYQEFKKWWKADEFDANNNKKPNLPERKNKEVDPNSFQSKSNNLDQQTSKSNNNNKNNSSSHSINNKRQNSSEQHNKFGESSNFFIIGGIIALSLVILISWLVVRKKRL